MFLSGGAGFQSTKVMARSWSVGEKTLHGENVFRARPGGVGDVEFVGAPGAGHVVGLGDLLSVEPDVGAVVDAVEIQPDRLALVSRGQGELLAIPPGNGEGTVGRHGDVGKIARRWDSSCRRNSRRFMPKNGSGRALSFTSAATTVVGTVASCHPLGENCGVEMTSPLASTLAEVCSVQPSCRTRRFSGEDFESADCASRGSVMKSCARKKNGKTRRMREVMVLLRIWCVRMETCCESAPKDGYHFY